MNEDKLMEAAQKAEYDRLEARDEGWDEGYRLGVARGRADTLREFRMERLASWLSTKALWMLLGAALGTLLGFGLAQVYLAERMLR